MIRITRLFALPALILCSSVTYGAAPKPELIPSGPNAYTQAKFDKARLAFYNRVIVEAYKKHGTRDAKWDAAAIAFLQRYCEVSVEPGKYPDGKAFAAECQAVIDAGCTDPLVLSCCGVELNNTGRPGEAESVLRKAIDELDKSSYPRGSMALLPQHLAAVLKTLAKLTTDEVRRLNGLTELWTLNSFLDGSFLPGEDRIALDLVRTSASYLPANKTAGFYDAVDTTNEVSRWIKKYIKGCREVEQAWKARGNAFADKVTEEGWKGFEQHLKIACPLLTEAWKLHPEYPEAPTEMIKVAMAGYAGEGETTRLWFKRAVGAQMDYSPAYSAYLWALRPRWEGSLEEMHEFGLACLRTRRFDTRTPWAYVTALANITEDLSGDKRYWKLPETWTRVQILLDGYGKADNPEIGNADRCQSLKAALAAYSERYPEADKILAGLGSRVDVDIVKQYYKEGGDDPVRTARSLGGPYGRQIMQAEKLHGLEAYGKAIAAYDKVLVAAKSDKYAHAYAEDRIEAIRMERTFAEGGWVDLRPRSDSGSWTKVGKWTVEPDGTIDATSTSEGLWAICALNVGDRFEIRGELEFADAKAGAVTAGATLDFGSTCWTANFRLDTDKLLIGLSGYNMETPKAGVKDTNKFSVQQWDGKMTVQLNGNMIAHNKTVGSYADEAHRVGLDGQLPREGLTVKFRNVQVRRLTEKP